MIYLLICAASAFFGLSSGLGATTLLRPLMDAISPLDPASVSALCCMATLCAALVSAFFALSEPLPLETDELLLLSVGAMLGGVLGDLASARFIAVMPAQSAVLLQSALLFTLIALPSVYFATLARTLRPLVLTRMFSFPIALVVGLLASFLAFGAEPITLSAYFLLFDAENDESAVAALTVALFSMLGKLIVLLIRMRLQIPNAGVLLWLLPGALIGALLAMIPRFRPRSASSGDALLRLSLFTSMLNVAAAIVH